MVVSRIDRQHGHWMETWVNLLKPNRYGQTADAVLVMAVTGATHIIQFQKMACAGGVTAADVDVGNIFVPLSSGSAATLVFAYLLLIAVKPVKIILNTSSGSTVH